MKGFRLLLISFVSLLISNQSKACDCLGFPFEYQVQKSEIIIVARVVQFLEPDSIIADKRRRNPDYVRSSHVMLNVDSVYKGGLLANERIEYIAYEGDCDIDFEADKSYLMFLHKFGDTYRLNVCYNNGKLEYALTDIKKIRKIIGLDKKPNPPSPKNKRNTTSGSFFIKPKEV